MDWQHFLGLGLIAAIITAASNFASTWFFSRRQQQQSASFDAIRLAVALERFSYECASRISGEITWCDSGGNAGAAFYELPPLVFPEEIAWQSLDLELVDRILVLENDLLRSEGIIKFELANLFMPDDSATEPREQAGLIGYRAHVIAQDLRALYQPYRNAERLHVWNHVATLKLNHDAKFEEYRKLNVAFNDGE